MQKLSLPLFLVFTVSLSADPLIIQPGLPGTASKEINSFGDHRIAMSFLVAGIRSDNGIRVKNCRNIDTSFPNFKNIMNKLGMKINEEN